MEPAIFIDKKRLISLILLRSAFYQVELWAFGTNECGVKRRENREFTATYKREIGRRLDVSRFDLNIYATFCDVLQNSLCCILLRRANLGKQRYG